MTRRKPRPTAVPSTVATTRSTSTSCLHHRRIRHDQPVRRRGRRPARHRVPGTAPVSRREKGPTMLGATLGMLAMLPMVFGVAGYVMVSR